MPIKYQRGRQLERRAGQKLNLAGKKKGFNNRHQKKKKYNLEAVKLPKIGNHDKILEMIVKTSENKKDHSIKNY